MNKLPKARTENLVEQNLGAETLIYDLLIDKAFNLNETSTIVYKACNGETTFDELKREHQFTDEFIYLALDELKKHDLLAEGYESPFAGMSRREIIRKVGLASMTALPVISFLVAPTAASAASGGVRFPGGVGIGQDCGPRFGSPTVYCGEGFCTTTTASGQTCCAPSTINSGKQRIPNGQNYFVVFSNFVVPSAADVPTGSYPCSNNFVCCDGRAVSGSCTVDDSFEFGGGGQYLVQSTCDDCNCY